MAMVLETIGKSTSQRSGNAAIIKTPEIGFRPTYPEGVVELLTKEQLSAIKGFRDFWTMMDTVNIHGYVSASMSLIGRSVVSAWFDLAKHGVFGNKATERQKKRLYNFYYSTAKDFSNIHDFFTPAYKILIGIMYFRYFGQAAYFKVRNELGQVIDWDHLPGLIVPNTDTTGSFLNPAFIQFPTANPKDFVEYKAEDVIYIVNPDWRGSILGGTDVRSLAEFTLPLDIYLQTAAREYLGNSNIPELMFMLPPDITDEAFDAVVEMLNSKYSGARNVGKNPIAVQGDLKIERIDSLPSDLPYQEARMDTRDETLAVTGTGTTMFGIGDSDQKDMREFRRNFFEQTIIPILTFFEQALYSQVHVMEFRIPGWEVRFNNPDFLTAVERATVDMRYIQTGVDSPNDVRVRRGDEPREGGDEYVDPTGSSGGENQGSPPEGREDRPDRPGETGEPTIDDQDPPRGDQHDDETRIISRDRERAAHGLRSWKKFVVGRMKRNMVVREYLHEDIPPEVSNLVNEYIEGVEDVEEIKIVFDRMIDHLIGE
jgi:hypothetical protein